MTNRKTITGLIKPVKTHSRPMNKREDFVLTNNRNALGTEQRFFSKIRLLKVFKNIIHMNGQQRGLVGRGGDTDECSFFL